MLTGFAFYQNIYSKFRRCGRKSQKVAHKDYFIDYFIDCHNIPEKISKDSYMLTGFAFYENIYSKFRCCGTTYKKSLFSDSDPLTPVTGNDR